MRGTTATIPTPFAGHVTGGTAEAPGSAAESAHDMGSVLAEFGKPDTQGLPTAHQDSDVAAI